MLKNYLFSQDSTLASPGPSSGQSAVVQTAMYVRADGSGNWYFSTQINAFTERAWQYAAGFIFVYSNDKTLAHGYIKTGPPDGSGTIDAFAVGGKDSWIAEHWPELFSQRCYFYVSDAVLGLIGTGQNDLPNTNNIATDNGFSGLTLLPARLVNGGAAYALSVSGGPPTDWVEEVGASGSSGQGTFTGGTGSTSTGDDDDDDDDDGGGGGSGGDDGS